MTQRKIARKEPALSAKDQIIQLAAGLSAEERADLAERGFLIPAVAGAPEDRTWGYRCQSCNDIGLEFVGTKFVDRNGNPCDKPDQTFAFADLPWVQPELPREKWDRANPICQHCSHPLVQHLGKLRSHMVVQIDAFRASRDKAMEELRRSRRLSPSGQMETQVQLEDGAVVTLKDGEQRWSSIGGSKAWSEGDREYVNEVAWRADLLGRMFPRSR